MTFRKLYSATALTAAGMLTVAAGPQPTTWNVDAAHTSVSFTVKHFFTPVKGQFEQFDVELVYDRENPENSSVHVKIPVASLSTGNPKRDNHLRSPDFFETEAHPYITFVSESVKKVSDEELLVRGPLTIKGQTKTVELSVRILGVMDVAPEMRDMLGGVGQIASFQTHLKLDRRDYGVGVGSWAATMVVGSDVDIEIAVEANR
jgi:polyisoprenoid-binding protein YceI